MTSSRCRTSRPFVRALIPAALLVLAGCASGLKLPDPSRDFPSDLAFAGDWQRVEFREQDRMEPERLRVPSSRDASSRASSGPRAKPGRKVRSFLEFGKSLRITQLDSAMLISFDRAIVVEYRYGEHRMTNVGPIAGERTTGFRGESLEIITLDDDGAQMTETWRLQRRGDVLERRVRIVRGKKDLYDLRESYRRTGG